MSLDEKFVSVRTGIYQIVGKLFENLAQFFGYPDNPGMPTLYDVSDGIYGRSQFLNDLPKRVTYFPPAQRPETWFEMIFGPAPRVDVLPRYIYETKEEGFYNFYIENYKNIFFLPDWLSEFIQIHFNICLDISLLEIIREVLFIGLVFYSQMVLLRIAISWLIWINPYTFPWSYLAAAVDWTEDVLQGIVPSVLGVNVTGSVFLGALGVVADSLNHLVLTMPFLPSEGEETKLVINNEMKDVLVFHYLPVLWYRHPIPNDLREFWYYQRPDIFAYMETVYKGLGLELFPDKIQKMNELTQARILHNEIHQLFREGLLIRPWPWE
ncbi:MAG: hypothetical protein ACK5Z3_04525 [Pseudanabaena sp.]|jgi:hypothetical protein